MEPDAREVSGSKFMIEETTMIDNLSIEDFLLKISLPKRYDQEEFIISEKYEEEKNNFLRLFKDCHGEEFKDKKNEKVHTVLESISTVIEANFNLVLDIFSYYEKADLGSAQQSFDILMANMKDDLFVSYIDDWTKITVDNKPHYTKFRMTPGRSFFRVRAVDSPSVDISDNANELFHIPFSKRRNVSNERFSLAGFPCLYLATMLPLAWQETGYPEKYYYSEFCYDDLGKKDGDRSNELRFLSIYSPNEIRNWGTSVKYNDFEFWIQVIKQSLIMYPLTLACAFVNSSGKSPFKQEYIIPQMLMQWIQRNIGFVQGVSYFTCLDTSAFTSSWCAYDLVLPALLPGNKDMYSIKLKEKLNWSMPIYYSIPIADKSKNVEDIKKIIDFRNDLLEALNSYDFDKQLPSYLIKMYEVAGYMQSLLKMAQNTNMQLILQMLGSIRSNYSNICNEKLSDLMEEIRSNEKKLSDDIIAEQCEKLKQIYDRFADRGQGSGEIGKIIDKYYWTTWNEFAPNNYLTILYLPDCKLDSIRKWFKENHILYWGQQLKADDTTVDLIKKIADENMIPVDTFWDKTVIDDEWMKENITSIKEPLIVKYHNDSILSTEKMKSPELICFGFDEDKIKKYLQL